MTFARLSKAALLGCLLPGFVLLAADNDENTSIRRFSAGIHVIYFPFPLLRGEVGTTFTTNPVAQYNTFGTSDSPKWSPGAQVEYRLSTHLAVAAELHFHHAGFTETTNLLSGANTSTTGGDNRPVTLIVQTSQANYYEVPLLLHYYGLWNHGWKRRLYLSLGAQLLHVGKIRTANDFTYPNGATDYNENPVTPNHANTVGGVFGIGMRFIDEFHIRISPEARIVYWENPAFSTTGYRSSPYQLECGVGIAF